MKSCSRLPRRICNPNRPDLGRFIIRDELAKIRIKYISAEMGAMVKGCEIQKYREGSFGAGCIVEDGQRDAHYHHILPSRTWVMMANVDMDHDDMPDDSGDYESNKDRQNSMMTPEIHANNRIGPLVRDFRLE